MSHQESVRVLASLLRASNEARPVLLLGAGASFSSGVPLAAESVRRMARRVFAEKVKGGSIVPEQVKLTEWQTWLQGRPWFIKGVLPKLHRCRRGSPHGHNPPCHGGAVVIRRPGENAWSKRVPAFGCFGWQRNRHLLRNRAFGRKDR